VRRFARGAAIVLGLGLVLKVAGPAVLSLVTSLTAATTTNTEVAAAVSQPRAAPAQPVAEPAAAPVVMKAAVTDVPAATTGRDVGAQAAPAERTTDGRAVEPDAPAVQAPEERVAERSDAGQQNAAHGARSSPDRHSARKPRQRQVAATHHREGRSHASPSSQWRFARQTPGMNPLATSSW
jgi:hypothetical protein